MSSNKRRNLTWAIVAAVVVIAAIAVLASSFGTSRDGVRQAVFKVRRGPLIISVTESGTIKNREEVEIKSQVEGRASILTLVPEGTQVKPGDLLVELDSSKLTERLDLQELKVINTLCIEVVHRQESAVALCGKVDVMFVLGGLHSANTRELARLCTQQGVTTHHLEDWEAFQPEYVRGCKVAGVTAGASTPSWIVDQFVTALEACDAES